MTALLTLIIIIQYMFSKLSVVAFKKLFGLSAIIICSQYCLAQSQASLIIDDITAIHNAKITIVSEVHSVNMLPEFKYLLIDKLYKDEGLTDLVLEISKSYAYLLNQYIETGDTSIIAAYPTWTNKQKEYWKRFCHYKELGRTIAIHGIDFERMEILPAIKRVLEKTTHTDNDMYKYIISLPDTACQLNYYANMKKQRGAIVDKLLSIYKYNISYYSSINDHGFIIKDICENPVLENNWNNRYDGMEQNLATIYQPTSHKYLLIVGADHVDHNIPIYQKLQKSNSLQDDDIINISVVAKDCEAQGMYYEKTKLALITSKSLLKEKAFCNALLEKNTSHCLYKLVYTKNLARKSNINFKCDYVLPIDCTLYNSTCN